MDTRDSMDTDFYLDNWWLWLLGLGLLLLLIIFIFHTILRFPGILDWKFLMHNFEERIQEPVKKFSQSLYGHMVVAGGVVVNRMTTRNYAGGQDSGRERKIGICEVNFDPEVFHNEETEVRVTAAVGCGDRDKE